MPEFVAAISQHWCLKNTKSPSPSKSPNHLVHFLKGKKYIKFFEKTIFYLPDSSLLSFIQFKRDIMIFQKEKFQK